MIPCKECITLPVCKNVIRDIFLKESYEHTIPLFENKIYNSLMSRCSIFKEYVYNNLSNDINNGSVFFMFQKRKQTIYNYLLTGKEE